MEKKKIDLRSLTKDEFEGIRIPVLFLKIQLFFRWKRYKRRGLQGTSSHAQRLLRRLNS